MKRLAFAFAVVVLATARASAYELNLATTSVDRPSIVTARAGVDHAFVGEIGYRRVVAWGDRQLFLGGDVALPWAGPDLSDYQVRATVGAPLGGRRWKIAAWLSPTVRGTGDVAGTMTALGADLRLTGGHYAPGWFIAGEVGLDWIAATHITMSTAYRRAYPGAKDGWYGTPGGTAYAGVQTGLSFRSFDVTLRSGLPRTTSLASQTIPAYLTVGVNVPLAW